MPSPATVVMVPSALTALMRWSRASAIKTLPSASTATLLGKTRLASVAGPPSPACPRLPSPAMVEMVFAWASTRRILRFRCRL